MYPDPQLLVHLCLAGTWRAARELGRLEPESLDTHGFVHLSTQQQMHLPANRLFRGRDDLLALFVDVERLTAPLRWETGLPGDPSEMLFPHLYGPLGCDAVVGVGRYLPLLDIGYLPLCPIGSSSTGVLVEYREV